MNIPTAEELFTKYNPQDGSLPQWAKDLMIIFAELHVEAALKAASENAESYVIGGLTSEVNEDSILNAYPLNNIK